MVDAVASPPASPAAKIGLIDGRSPDPKDVRPADLATQEQELLLQARSREEEARKLSRESKDLFREATGLRARARRLKEPRKDDPEVCPEEDPLLDGLGQRLGYVPLMGEDILIDDDNAALVLVFTKCIDRGGTVDPEEEVKDHMAECHKIFVRQSNTDSINTLKSGFDCFDLDVINTALYHEVVRAKVLKVLQGSGIRAETFDSIDGDETFVKLSLQRDGEVIKSLAQRSQYRLPFNREAYSQMPPSGTYKGGAPMMNRSGVEVPAYTEFEFELQDYLRSFRGVDELRLILYRLDEWMSLEELVKQKVLSRYFAAANYDMVMKLHTKWAGLDKICQMPNNDSGEDIKDYFGEAVGFFFRWYAFYTRMLAPLAVFGLVCSLRGVKAFHLLPEQKEYVQYLFAVFLVVWSTIFNELFKNAAAREQQHWGMKDYDEMSLELSTYRPSLEGTWRLAFRKVFTKVVAVLFCLGFVAFLFFLQWRKVHMSTGKPEDENLLGDSDPKGPEEGSSLHDGVFLTVVIQVASQIWRFLAPWLVGLQNHRTDARWNDALTIYLATVKIFVALFPFLDITFLKKWKHATCTTLTQNTLASAAWRLYGSRKWPVGLPKPMWNQTDSRWEDPPGSYSLEELMQGYFFQNSNGEYCMYGCYPVKCLDGFTVGHKSCTTNCDLELASGLYTFYLTHVASTVLFLVIPIFLTRWEVKKEYDKVHSKAAEERKDGEVVYSFMQFQAKCHELANYEYDSWGGSYCEDFLGRAISFALLTCFGIHKPILSVLAFCSAVLEYRLLAYRMTNLTCRPMPAGAEGIGIWQQFFEGISFIAVATNVAMAVFFMHPMKTWSWGSKFLAFVVLEHIMLLLRAAVDFAIPDEPEDVQRIQDFNVKFKRKFVKYDQLQVPQHERHNMGNVDIGLGVSWL